MCKNVNGNTEKIIPGNNNHVIKQEFEKGKLVWEIEYIKNDTGLLHDGYEKKFYNNGRIRSQANYKDGRLDGYYYDYSIDGIVIQRLLFYHTVMLGSQFRFYKNGKIKDYTYYSALDNYQCRIRYDSLENTEQLKGHPDSLCIEGNKTNFIKSDTIWIYNHIAQPYKTKVVVTVKLLDRKNKCFYTKDFADFGYLQFADMHVLPFEYYGFDGSGKYVAITKLFDSATGKLKFADTVSYLIKIK